MGYDAGCPLPTARALSHAPHQTRNITLLSSAQALLFTNNVTLIALNGMERTMSRLTYYSKVGDTEWATEAPQTLTAEVEKFHRLAERELLLVEDLAAHGPARA